VFVGLFYPLEFVTNVFGPLNYSGLQVRIIIAAIEVIETLLFKFVDFVPPGEEDWLVSERTGLIVLCSDSFDAFIGHPTQIVDEILMVSILH